MKKIFENTRKLCFGEKGQNYWFNGSMEYLMDCLKENTEDYNYWFFSNVSGDSLMQLYSRDIYKTAWCPSQNVLDKNSLKRVFDACGYEFDHISGINDANRKDFLIKIRKYIDNNIPVLCRGGEKLLEYACICGYNDEELYYLICDTDVPQAFANQFTDLIFVGSKKTCLPLSEIYKKTVLDIPSFILRPSTINYSFGRQAFIDWAESFMNETFDNIPKEQVNSWNVHGTYLCMMGTNGCVINFIKKALEMNPEMTFINELIPLYEKQQAMFHDLAYEKGGLHDGFDIKPEIIKNKALMKPISDKIIDAANICNDILDVFNKNKKSME